MKIEEREQACLNLLRQLPERFVLIGGYAVSAFEFPRFSVDLDLVVPEKDLDDFSAILEGEGFSRTHETDHFALAYRGSFVRFQKMVQTLPVSVDLLVGMVQCRQTDAAYSFDYVWRNSEVRVVTGFGVRASVQARVADREMLMALKINSMRMADQRDIIALCSANVDVSKVTRHLRRAPREKIRENIQTLLSFLESPRSRDSLKGVFVLSDSVLQSLLNRTRKTLEEIREKLNGKARQKG
jgi:hypothetical protein